MDSDVYVKLGENIHDLRVAYGETLEDLAFGIGLNSPSAITNYEKGTRIPKREYLRRIAARYRVTVDELINGDFSKWNFTSLPLGDKKMIQAMNETMLPIVYSDAALEDELFVKGYTMHIEIYKKINAGNEYKEEEYLSCMEAYDKSLETNSTPESAANKIWWLLFLGFGIGMNEMMVEGIKALKENKIDTVGFLQHYWVRDFDDEMINEQNIERKIFLENIDEEFTFLLNLLNQSPVWTSLAEYYSALRYVLCVVNNHKSDDANREIGIEMMCSIANMGNLYAHNFIMAGKENI